MIANNAPNFNMMLPKPAQNNQSARQNPQTQIGQLKSLQTTQTAVSNDSPRLSGELKSDVVLVNKKEADKKTLIALGISLLAAAITGISAFKFGKTKAVPAVERAANAAGAEKVSETTKNLLEKTVADAKEFQVKAENAAEKAKEYVATVEEKLTGLKNEVVSLFEEIQDKGEIVVDGKTLARIEDSSKRSAVKILKEFNDDGTTLRRQSAFVPSFVDGKYKPQTIEEFIDGAKNISAFDAASGDVDEYLENIYNMADGKISADKYTVFYGAKGSMCYENCEILYNEDHIDGILKYSNFIELRDNGKLNMYAENYDGNAVKKAIGLYDIPELSYDNMEKSIRNEAGGMVCEYIPGMRYAEGCSNDLICNINSCCFSDPFYGNGKENIASKIIDFEDKKPVYFFKADGADNAGKSALIWQAHKDECP